MESAEAKVRYVIHSTVKEVERLDRDVYCGGLGKDAIYAKENLGWFLWLEGSHEKIFLDRDSKPDVKVGDKIRITIEKEQVDAEPSQPPI